LPSHARATVATIPLLAGISSPSRRLTALPSHCLHNCFLLALAPFLLPLPSCSRSLLALAPPPAISPPRPCWLPYAGSLSLSLRLYFLLPAVSQSPRHPPAASPAPPAPSSPPSRPLGTTPSLTLSSHLRGNFRLRPLCLLTLPAYCRTLSALCPSFGCSAHHLLTRAAVSSPCSPSTHSSRPHPALYLPLSPSPRPACPLHALSATPLPLRPSPSPSYLHLLPPRLASGKCHEARALTTA